MRPLHLTALGGAGLFTGMLAVPAAMAQAADAAQVNAGREQAVIAAREGRLEQAIAELRRLETISSDRRIAFDLAVVLTWGAVAFALALLELFPLMAAGGAMPGPGDTEEFSADR